MTEKKKMRVRETLYSSNDPSELCFNILEAEKHFSRFIDADVSSKKYDAYFVNIDEDVNSWSIEGVRPETDDEAEWRISMGAEDFDHAEYNVYLRLKDKYEG